jgi:PAS domain S-box-containing protein
VSDAGPAAAEDPTDAAQDRDRLRLMLSRLPGFVYQTAARPGEADRFTYMSSDVFLTGHHVEEWYDDPGAWKALVHPDDLDAVSAADQTSVETGAPYQMVHRARRVDGSWIWVLDTAQVHIDNDGVRRWTGFCQDVTERYRLERAREVHVRRLLLLLERIHAVVYELDEQGLAYVSPGTVSGRSTDDFVADPELWRQIVHVDDRQRVGAQMAAALRGRAEVAFDFRMVAPDGTVTAATNHLVPYVEADGSTTFIGFVLDVTEQRRAEESAQVALHQLRLAVEHAGVTPYEFQGGRPRVRSGDGARPLIVHPADQEAFAVAHAEAQPAGAQISLEFRYRLDSGDWRWGLARASRVPAESAHSLPMVSGVLIDITREHDLGERWRDIEDALTPREQQTFALLGSGATNNEIASALGISHSTTTHHVARVLSKLGLPNRAAGAALASEMRQRPPLGERDDRDRG